SRRCLGRRVLNRSVGSRMWPSAETTSPLVSVIPDPLSERFWPRLLYRGTVTRPVGTSKERSRDTALDPTPGRLHLGRVGRRRRARSHQPPHAREGARGRAGGADRRDLLPEPAARLPGWHRPEPAPLPTAPR